MNELDVLYNYRGRIIKIDKQFLLDFKKYNGYEFDDDIADGYIYNKYIKKGNSASDVSRVVSELTDLEIESTIHEALRYLLSLYTCYADYGK